MGSDAGVNLVRSGDIDLAFISREVRAAEAGTVETVPIGATGTGIAVTASNKVTTVTKDQLANIFTGETISWSTLGGDAAPIRVLVREAGSATRNALEAYCYGGKPPLSGYAKNAIEVGSYDETVKAMQSISGAVGMMSMSAAAFSERSIHLLSIDGVPATRESLLNGKYPMRRPLYLVYSSDPAKVKPAIRAFIDFVKSPQGQAVLDSL